MPRSIKLLIAVPSPRDIAEFHAAMNSLPYDQYWVKYERSYRAYPKLREFFLSHEQYTHVAICPDDMIPTREGIEQLLKDLEEKDYPVLCGTSSIDENDPRLSLCRDKLPTPERSTRIYEFMTRTEAIAFVTGGQKIIRVAHAGTPFEIMRRDVVEKVDWRGDGYCNDELMHNGVPLRDSWAQDVVISNDLAALDIPIHADLRVFFKHLRHAGEILVGKKTPSWIYVQDGVRTIDTQAVYQDLVVQYEQFDKSGGFRGIGPQAQTFLEALMAALGTLTNTSLTTETKQ